VILHGECILHCYFGLVAMMKQVARKSTTSLPQKLSAGSHQPNGLVREPSTSKVCANAKDTSFVSKDAASDSGLNLDADKSEQRNGIIDSCKQALSNGTVQSVAGVVADSRQQANSNFVCSVTSASNLPISAGGAPLPVLTSAGENGKNFWHAENTPLPDTVSADSPDDVIIVQGDETVDAKPNEESVPGKRSLSPADDNTHCKARKVKHDGTVDQSAKVEASSRLLHKVLRYSSNFSIYVSR